MPLLHNWRWKADEADEKGVRRGQVENSLPLYPATKVDSVFAIFLCYF
jgi:hypothetical protein